MSKSGVCNCHAAFFQVVIQDPKSFPFGGRCIFSLWLPCHYAYLQQGGGRRKNTEQPEVFVCQVYTWSHVTFVHISLVVTKFQGTLKLHMGWRVESRCLAWNEQEQNCKRCSITVLVVVD